MAWLVVTVAFAYVALLAVGQEICMVPAKCDNADGSTTVKTVVLPSMKDARKWRNEAAKAKKDQAKAPKPTVSSTPHCMDPGWMTGQGGECQYKILAATLTWEKARQYCRAQGAELSYQCIRKGDNYRYLTDNLKGINVAGFWIGLSDRAKEGEWKWIDGTAASNVKWGNNQPDNQDGKQNCGWISRNIGYNVDDGDCNAQFFPICERLI